ncbi:MAG: ABC transporter ATP-binding protein, partial [Planctomycetota bacterium]
VPPYILLFKFLNPRVRRAGWLVQSSISRISGNVQERLAGIALVKTSAAEERELDAFRTDAEIHYGRNVTVQKLAQFVQANAEFLMTLNQIIVVGYGGYMVLRGDISPGDVVKFIGFLAAMYMPIRRFAEVNIVFQQSAASIERVFQVFDITPRITERPDAVSRAPDSGEVQFENVFFDYRDESDESKGLPERHNPKDLRGDPVHDARRQKRRHFVDRGRLRQRRQGTDVYEQRKRAQVERYFTRNSERDWVLDNLDFTVTPGEKVALVGPSGAGKTTLVSLLPRLYDVDHGAIRIDGVDIRDYRLDVLRRAIGIVQQDSFLFSGSVRDNLKYGKPSASDDEMIAAAEAANAHEFISKLDDGYDSRVGERGVSLSGGQKQRLSIARAILKDPRILILDEATSALDTESERLVQEALERLMANRTALIIAHRLSTVRNADRILVLKAGRVVESGNHDTLVEQAGLYARLVKQQFGPEQTADA